MNLKLNLYEDTVFRVIRLNICLQTFWCLIVIIMFTKRKVGAHIAMPIKGNVHLLFHNVQNSQYLLSRAFAILLKVDT